MRLIDETGNRYGRLLVVGRGETLNKKVRWICLCDCGNELPVQGYNLRTGNTRSCGCLRSEMTAARSTKHGMAGLPEYRAWKSISQRCSNPNKLEYPDYGGRGIRVCERWQNSFEAFYEDMGPRPAGASIDRIDNDGDYEPGNCRWATAAEQANNRRSSRLVTYRGETKTVAQWSRVAGVSYSKLHYRLNIGWPVDRALETP